jgi:Tfp pilus assembly protein PilV
MPSNRAHGIRWAPQQGIGLVEVLVASALLGVALVVLLGSLGSLLIGARTAERRIVEERLARNQIESLLASPLAWPFRCPSAQGQQSSVIDGVVYNISAIPTCRTNYVEWVVTVREVTDKSNAGLSLTVGQAAR